MHENGAGCGGDGSGQFVASRFVSLSFDDDGSLIVHSSRTGAIGVVPPDQAEAARRALLPGVVTRAPLAGVLADLAGGGLLVPSGMDETQLVHDSYLQRYDHTTLHLIIMPTEHCNFRCVYCYESFLRGEMSPAIQDGIRRFVRSQQDLERLDVHWFGGEPLLAPGVVSELTGWFGEHTRQHGIAFDSGATTNGSLLTPEVADRIIPLGVRTFQITLDGVEHDHDLRRRGAHGEKTFQSIIDNLRHLRDSSYDFRVMLRHNFDPDSVRRLDRYLAMISEEFAGDPRFTTHWAAIGRWGGPNDADLLVCEGRSASHAILDARRAAAAAGFRDEALVASLQPNGSVCYAADPRSFVIGSDGGLYKCTVELDYHDRNQVGRLRPDGVMELDWHKMALWCETDGMETGKKCTSCWFSPGCHGATCPKEWMDHGDAGCPPAKQMIGETLRFIRSESLLAVGADAPGDGPK
jgi:uncharacterized protein